MNNECAYHQIFEFGSSCVFYACMPVITLIYYFFEIEMEVGVMDGTADDS